MSVADVLKDLDEEDRLLYLSAVEVKKSVFWNRVMKDFEEIAESNKSELLTQTMQGDEKRALIAACKIQAVGFAKERMQHILDEVTVLALNQEQEEDDA